MPSVSKKRTCHENRHNRNGKSLAEIPPHEGRNPPKTRHHRRQQHKHDALLDVEHRIESENLRRTIAKEHIENEAINMESVQRKDLLVDVAQYAQCDDQHDVDDSGDTRETHGRKNQVYKKRNQRHLRRMTNG